MPQFHEAINSIACRGRVYCWGHQIELFLFGFENIEDRALAAETPTYSSAVVAAPSRGWGDGL